MVFTIKLIGLSCKFSHHPILWHRKNRVRNTHDSCSSIISLHFSVRMLELQVSITVAPWKPFGHGIPLDPRSPLRLLLRLSPTVQAARVGLATNDIRWEKMLTIWKNILNHIFFAEHTLVSKEHKIVMCIWKVFEVFESGIPLSLQKPVSCDPYKGFCKAPFCKDHFAVYPVFVVERYLCRHSCLVHQKCSNCMNP